jgi:hypothetical protein
MYNSSLLPNSILHPDPVLSCENQIYVPQFKVFYHFLFGSNNLKYVISVLKNVILFILYIVIVINYI